MNVENQFGNFKDIPPIGFGPGIAGYSPKKKKQKTGLAFLCDKAYNRFYKQPKLQRDYVNSVVNAFKVGFRILDYSSSYGDGTLIGEAIRRSGVSREELFITTRVSNRAQREHTIREEFLSLP